ncbi:MAG: symmetrical bis(5'-nucleosyl)-tetraphosphatase [Limnohabitans sp.]|nr:symmetrical bis(5'-nucleosyl)-tetraphosphatase [Limnohabitans sp.]
MSMYLIGDVQGCDRALQRLLDKLQFSPTRDTLFLLGDLVNRGPDNTAVLRRLQKLGNSARCLLGNHDLNLLAMHLGLTRPKPGDTVQDVLSAPDRDSMMLWLRSQSLAMHEAGVLMVHAGVLPQWSLTQTLSLAAEVETVLRGPHWTDFMAHMYGSQPDRWHDSLTGHDRLRVIVNGLTRLRFCTSDGAMEFAHHSDVKDTPDGYLPWFDVPDRQTRHTTVAFGHWSSLSALGRDDVIELDTGCVWGRCLSALKIDLVTGLREKIQVNCSEAAQTA